MEFCKKGMGIAMLTVLCLFFAGCAGKVEETQPTSYTTESPVSTSGEEADGVPGVGTDDGEIAITARFLQEDGGVLSHGSASISDGETDVKYSLDDDGEMWVSGLPREGTILLILFDQEEQELGRTTVMFSTGAVIDASTDEAGAGYITLKEDTSEVSLVFTLCGDGSLQCSLWLGA